MTESKNIRGKRRNQKRVALALDADLDAWINETQANRNRYINGVIRADMELTRLKKAAEERGDNLGEALTAQREDLETSIKIMARI